MLVSFLDPEIQRSLKILLTVLERVLEQIDDMLVPQIWEEIVCRAESLSQIESGVFTLDGLFVSGRDCVAPKTRMVTPDGQYDSSWASDVYNREYPK